MRQKGRRRSSALITLQGSVTGPEMAEKENARPIGVTRWENDIGARAQGSYVEQQWQGLCIDDRRKSKSADRKIKESIAGENKENNRFLF